MHFGGGSGGEDWDAFGGGESRTIQRFQDDERMMDRDPQDGNKFLELANSALEEMIEVKKRVDSAIHTADHQPSRETASALEKEVMDYAEEYMQGESLVTLYQNLIDQETQRISDSLENPSERWSYRGETHVTERS